MYYSFLHICISINLFEIQTKGDTVDSDAQHCQSVWQEWWNPSVEAESRRSFPGPDPFKPGVRSPFRRLPSCEPSSILVDSAHSFHIKGIGVDWCASCIVLGCFKGLWGQGSLDARLERAHKEFQEYCVRERRVTSCDVWSELKFDMTTNRSFPLSIAGKGFDTAVCCIWLEDCFTHKASQNISFSLGLGMGSI